MCGTRLIGGTLVCEACGTDLSRSAVLLSSQVKPLSRSGSGKKIAFRILRVIAGAVVVSLGIIALGGVPQVSARVPVLGTFNDRATAVFQHVWNLGRSLVPGQRPKVVQQPAAVPSPAAVPPPTVTSPPAPAVATPQAPPPPTASSQVFLMVRSTPPGAQVHLNATKVGTTPVTIKNVKPGTYQVKITRAGYVPVYRTVEVRNRALTLDVTLNAAPPQRATPKGPVPSTGQKGGTPGSAQVPRGEVRRPLAIGEPAPGFVLKDRLGVLYRLEDQRGRKTVVLIVWSVDDPIARRAIMELDARFRPGSGRDAVVIVLKQDRVAVRNLVAAAHLRIPMLFGTAQVARAYGVSNDIAVLYVVSEQGLIERRQVMSVQPAGRVP